MTRHAPEPIAPDLAGLHARLERCLHRWAATDAWQRGETPRYQCGTCLDVGFTGITDHEPAVPCHHCRPAEHNQWLNGCFVHTHHGCELCRKPTINPRRRASDPDARPDHRGTYNRDHEDRRDWASETF